MTPVLEQLIEERGQPESARSHYNPALPSMMLDESSSKRSRARAGPAIGPDAECAIGEFH